MFNKKLFRARLTLAYFASGGKFINENVEDYLDDFVDDFVEYVEYQQDGVDSDDVDYDGTDFDEVDYDEVGPDEDLDDSYDEDCYVATASSVKTSPVNYGRVPLCSIHNALVVEGYVVEFDYHDSKRHGKVTSLNVKKDYNGDYILVTLEERDCVKNYDSRKISNLKVVYQTLGH